MEGLLVILGHTEVHMRKDYLFLGNFAVHIITTVPCYHNIRQVACIRQKVWIGT